MITYNIDVVHVQVGVINGYVRVKNNVMYSVLLVKRMCICWTL